MNNIKKIIFENLEEFSKNFKGLNITHKHDEDCFRGCHIYNDLFSHILQSQIRLLEAVIEELFLDQYADSYRYCEECPENWHTAYNKALEDQISSLNQVKEEIKNILK